MTDIVDTAPGQGPASPGDRLDSADPAPGDERMWSARLRGVAVRNLPPGKLLPDRQPSYVASWVYIFGVLSFAAFFVILLSGVVLILRGPSWWHQSKVGLFFNSIHLWSVELFFFFMVLHLWGKFFMAAWRGKRALTWMTGVITFAVSIGAAFTGYLSQQNFDSQWISTQAKDGLNSVGVGAFFNVLNFGQMILWHVLLLPVVVGALIAVHLLLVRRRGVVRPLPARTGRSARHASTSRQRTSAVATTTEGVDR
jgi:ubiquinol-cytochrome c reductase cytochrome b subunit